MSSKTNKFPIDFADFLGKGKRFLQFQIKESQKKIQKKGGKTIDYYKLKGDLHARMSDAKRRMESLLLFKSGQHRGLVEVNGFFCVLFRSKIQVKL